MSRNCGLFMLLFTTALFAYDENSMPSLSVPTQLEPQCLEASVTHGFQREPASPFPDNFISHANVLVGLKYVPLPKFEVGTSYQFLYKEFTFDAAYTINFPQFLRAQAMLQYFGASHDDDQAVWDYNFLYQLNVQTEPIAGLCVPSINLAYNGLSKKIGIGTGIDIVLLKNLDFLAEYYPILGTRDTSYTGNAKVNYMLLGLKITTAGHQFMLTIANDYDLGVRRHMAGAIDNTLFYGFSIHRLFAF